MKKYVDDWKHFLTENVNIDDIVKNLSEDDKNFMKEYEYPILRKFMSSEEIKKANNLVKLGLMNKGISDDSRNTVVYYVDSYVFMRL